VPAQHQNTLFFDIETGGFSGRHNPILSISWAHNQEAVETRYAKLAPGAAISRWSENKIWEPIRSRMSPLINEQHALMDFLSQLEGAPENTRLVGWNIGYVAAAQSKTRAAGFDVQMIIERARQMGMEERARKAFARHQLVDIGAEWAWRIARGLTTGPVGERLVQQGVLHETLLEQARGFVKKGAEYASRYGLQSDVQIAEALSRHNRWFTGWKQELVYEVIMGRPLESAHASDADVRALRQIMAAGGEVNEEFLRKWAPMALRNKLVGQLKFVPETAAEMVPERYTGIMAEAERWGLRGEVETELRKTARLSGIEFSEVMAGRGIALRERVVRGAGIADELSRAGAGQLAGLMDDITPFLKSHWGKIAIGAGLTAGYLLQPGQWFSGKDDEYNVIEGLPHGGIAERMRRGMTDFGSGWVRAALKRGVSVRDIARASFKSGGGGGATQAAFIAGVEEQFKRGTGRGLRYMRQVTRGEVVPTISEYGGRVTSFRLGEQIAAGGMGEVRAATVMRTGEQAVYKTAREGMGTGTFGGDILVGGGAGGATSSVMQIQQARKIAEDFGMQKQLAKVESEFVEKGALEQIGKQYGGLAKETEEFGRAAGTMIETAATTGGKTFKDPIQYEAFIQKQAHMAMPKHVPDVLGTSRVGFFQEHAGRKLTEQEMPQAVAWARRQFKQLMKGEKGVQHLDPHMGQITMHPQKGYQMIDWGLAAPAKVGGHPPAAVADATQMLDYNMKMALGGEAFTRSHMRIMDAGDAATEFMRLHKDEIARKTVQRQSANAAEAARQAAMSASSGPLPPGMPVSPMVPGAVSARQADKAERIGSIPGIKTGADRPAARGTGTVRQRLRKNTPFGSPTDLNRTTSGDVSKRPKVASRQNRGIMEPNQQKKKRKATLQVKHKESAIRASQNSLRPGKRHRHSAGRIVI